MNCRPSCSCARVHHVVCEHRIEIEVWPARAEVYFRDERYSDPACSQVRFEATVFNAPTCGVHWSVLSPEGGVGRGTIDITGLYTAPDKGAIPHGTTDIIVAAAADDPERRACALVTLIGKGPPPPPKKVLVLTPRRSVCYYPSGMHNAWIDPSNSRVTFTADLFNTEGAVDWLVDGSVNVAADTTGRFTWAASGSGSPKTVKVRARLSADASVYDDAVISVVNYQWPGIV